MGLKDKTWIAGAICVLTIFVIGAGSAFAWHDFLSPTWATPNHTYKCDSSLSKLSVHSSVSPCADLDISAQTWNNVKNSKWILTNSTTGEIPIGAKLLCTNCKEIAQTKRTLDSNNKITSSKIWLNTMKSYSDTTQTTGTYKDYQTVILHEMGHLLRLGHEGLDSHSPMYFTIPDDTEKRVLTHHDKSAIAGQY